jgi:hypothetical protein
LTHAAEVHRKNMQPRLLTHVTKRRESVWHFRFTPARGDSMRTIRKQIISEVPSEPEQGRVIERADGYYWQSKDARREMGPFATLLEAIAHLQLSDDETPEEGETREEAEAEIGIADWIDADTGEVAEEALARIEEH